MRGMNLPRFLFFYFLLFIQEPQIFWWMTVCFTLKVPTLKPRLYSCFQHWQPVQRISFQAGRVHPSQLPRDQRHGVAPLLSLPSARPATQGGFPRRGGMASPPSPPIPPFVCSFCEIKLRKVVERNCSLMPPVRGKRPPISLPLPAAVELPSILRKAFKPRRQVSGLMTLLYRFGGDDASQGIGANLIRPSPPPLPSRFYRDELLSSKLHTHQIGDWTEELFRLCLENPQMPLWITAAQPSVLERTAYYDNGECARSCVFPGGNNPRVLVSSLRFSYARLVAIFSLGRFIYIVTYHNSENKDSETVKRERGGRERGLLTVDRAGFSRLSYCTKKDFPLPPPSLPHHASVILSQKRPFCLDVHHHGRELCLPPPSPIPPSFPSMNKHPSDLCRKNKPRCHSRSRTVDNVYIYMNHVVRYPKDLRTG